MLLPSALARSGGLPAGTYAVTITPVDIPPGFPPEAADILVATWMVEFNEDGSSIVYRNGEEVAINKYTSNKTHLVYRDISGPLACLDAPGIATGVYIWSLENDELTLTTVLDRCFGRNFVLTLRPLQRL
jgi:hypothetical protein